jgi:TPR repeat protein
MAEIVTTSEKMDSSSSFYRYLMTAIASVLIALHSPSIVFADGATAEQLHNLGAVYFYGMGKEVDRSKGCRLFEQAAAQGYSRSEYNLGNCFRTGDYDGVIRLDKAHDSYIKAAAYDETNALVALAALDFELSAQPNANNGSNSMLEIAVRVDPDHIEANFHLGISYAKGRAIKMDHEKAIHHLSVAEKGGNFIAKALRIYLQCDFNRGTVMTQESDSKHHRCDQEKQEFELDAPKGFRPEVTYASAIEYLSTKEWIPK